MDSHDDVHLDNVFSKSISERKTKIFHLHDHEYKTTSKVGEPLNVYEKQLAWSDLGINKSGVTMALMMDSEIMKEYNSLMFKQYLANKQSQHSVGMQYVNIQLAVNDKDYKDEYAAYKSYIDRIGNADKAAEQGYFWAVKEAKLLEISAVLEGSNELTPTVANIPPSSDTEKRAAESTHQKTINYLIQNFKIK